MALTSSSGISAKVAFAAASDVSLRVLAICYLLRAVGISSRMDTKLYNILVRPDLSDVSPRMPGVVTESLLPPPLIVVSIFCDLNMSSSRLPYLSTPPSKAGPVIVTVAPCYKALTRSSDFSYMPERRSFIEGVCAMPSSLQMRACKACTLVRSLRGTWRTLVPLRACLLSMKMSR